MEHLVIRNPVLNNKNLEVIQFLNLREINVLTESLIGRVPPAFAPVDHDIPLNVHSGDLVWLAQAGYGVVGTLRVTDVQPVKTVRCHEDIDGLKRDPVYSSLEATYWEHLREKLPRLKGRPMYFASVTTAFDEQFSEAKQFRLNTARGYQQSWVVLDDAKKTDLFAKRGQSVSAALAEDESNGDYGTITPRVRLLVARIWKDHYFGERKGNELLHYDHLVPHALGGPGIFVENIAPVPESINLAKQHFVLPELAQVAHEWALLSDEEYRTWGEMFDNNGTVLERQRFLTKRLTEEIRNRPPTEQRRFYFQILERVIGSRVRELYAAAGALPPGL